MDKIGLQAKNAQPKMSKRRRVRKGIPQRPNTHKPRYKRRLK